MKRLLMLVPLTLLAVATAAEAQSQAGGLPDVSARVQVLETQTQTLETRVQLLQSENTALQAALNIEVQARKAALADAAAAIIKEANERAIADAKAAQDIDKAKQELAQEIQARVTADAKAQQDINKAQQDIAKETDARVAADVQTQQALATEAEVRLNADTNLGAKLDVFGGADIFSAQFETVGAGFARTNEFVHILSEFVGPGSWVAIATISHLRGDTLLNNEEEGRLATRECQLRNVAGGFIGGMGTSNHDADGVGLVVIGGINVAPSTFGEIALWCRVTLSEFSGAEWDGAQMVTLKVVFRED